jgi:8-oxo-dGTP pyrophosphatase MutT (NUDIX family)
VTDAADDGRSRWENYGERVIYDNPWVRLAQVDVQIPGGERFWHHVVRLNPAAMIVLVDDRDRVLLMWRHRFVADRWGWELPGGVVEPGEDPAVTAARELAEETGYEAGKVEHLVTFEPMNGMLASAHSVFIGREPRRCGEPADASEADRVEWVPLADVPGLIAAGKIWSGGTLVALLGLLALRPGSGGEPGGQGADPAVQAG